MSIIINPKNLRPEHSVLLEIQEALKDVDFKYSVYVSTPSTSIAEIVEGLGAETDTILVYGGDGSLMEVVNRVFHKRQNYHPQLTVGVLAGGTANVMAKELGTESSVSYALERFVNNEFDTKKIDLGELNGESFFLRINVGGFAQMVTETSEEEKSSFGMFAYSLSGIQQLLDQDTMDSRFRLTIDGQQIETEGIGLMISNSGNIGIKGVSFLPGISVTDGLLDVILLERVGLNNLVQIAAERVLGAQDIEKVKHWQGKEIFLELDQPQTVIRDDKAVEMQRLEIRVKPSEVNMIVFDSE